VANALAYHNGEKYWCNFFIAQAPGVDKLTFRSKFTPSSCKLDCFDIVTLVSGSMTLSITTLSIMTFSIMTFSIMTLSIRGLFVTFSISDSQHQHN
jgi:hypothetical protein